jgi:hypothetical protein
MIGRMLTGIFFATVLLSAERVFAQGPPPGLGPQGPPPAARLGAPIDLTGNWVSIITEDWRHRMITPPKGDFASVPTTPAARAVGNAWDPAKDAADGQHCKAYGAAGIMRLPGRLRVAWQDDNTMKVEFDTGMQTRLLHFGAWTAPGGEATWQGDSVAEWVTPPRGRGAPPGAPPGGGAGGPRAGGPAPPQFGYLKVVTTHMRPGYLRKNGVPYSANTVLTEYFSLHRQRNGDQWLVVTTMIEDPQNLQVPWLTSPNFKREADGSKWDPTPCASE